MGLVERVGDGVKREDFGGNWTPGSLALTGDVLLSVGLFALCSDCLSTPFDSVPKRLQAREDSLVGGIAVSLSAEPSL